MLEFFPYILAVFTGMLIGTIAGLLPGLHTNSILPLIVATAHLGILGPLPSAIFILATAITQSFVDLVPSIFLGAPEEDTALSITPAHKMLMEGKGYHALKLSTYGGLVAITSATILFPLMQNTIPNAYDIIRPYIPYLLITVAGYMIFLEKNKFKGLLIFILAGLLGFISLNSNLSNSHTIFVLLTGLFGISTLLASIGNKQNNIPQQRLDIRTNPKETIADGFLGYLGGIFAGFLPGVGSSQSAIVMQKLSGKEKPERFITIIGSINTTDAILSIVALYLIGNDRSGSAVAIENILGQITAPIIWMFIAFAILISIIAAKITLTIGKTISSVLPKINYKKTNITILILLVIISAYLTGLYGLLIVICGTTLGLLTQFWKVKKSLLIGSLMIPTTLFFLGISPLLLKILGI